MTTLNVAPRTRIVEALRAALRALFDALPIVLGMLLLTSLVTTLVPAELLQRWLGRGGFADVLAAAAIGSVAADRRWPVTCSAANCWPRARAWPPSPRCW